MRKRECLETFISLIYFDRKYAYKIKKPVNLGFLDFSTLEKRRFYCIQEYSLNKRLCEDMYVGVVPVRSLGRFPRFSGVGTPVDYAVKMKRFPQNRLMANLLKKNMVSQNDIVEISRIVSNFHTIAETSDDICRCGGISAVKFNWDENFAQASKFRGSLIDADSYDMIKSSIEAFIPANKELFDERIRLHRIKWCHGDLHSGNIFILRGCTGTMRRIYIFNCIEFNTRFAWLDVASDVAFLAMDLDYYRKKRFSRIFVDSYVSFSRDKGILPLLNFYKCYHAFVKSKISLMRLEENSLNGSLNADEEAKVKNDAQSYFELAKSYALKL